MKNKSELRTWAKSLRKTLDISYISDKICQNIKQLELYKKSEHIMIFYPLADEINLLSLLSDNKNFYLPRVFNDNLEVCPYKVNAPLKLSKYNTQEPMTDPVDKNVLDIIFTPALCSDSNFYRIGYGGGFYDRFLSQASAKSIIVIPHELLVSDINPEHHDIQCSGIITQKKASFRG